MGRIGQPAYDVVEGRRTRQAGLAADRQRRSVRRPACRQGQRRSGRGTLHGRRVLLDRLLAQTRRRRSNCSIEEGTMAEGRLYIGNRRYSSWSMRGWLAVKLAGLDVEEVLIHFSRPGPTEAIGKLSPNGLVPYLEHRGARVWESLRLRGTAPSITPSLWPADRIARAHARADQCRDACRVPRLAAGDVDEPRARFLRARPNAGGAGRYRAHRGDVGRYAPAFRRGWDRSCSAPHSPRPMRCTRRWSRGSSPGGRRSLTGRAPIATPCAHIPGQPWYDRCRRGTGGMVAARLRNRQVSGSRWTTSASSRAILPRWPNSMSNLDSR